MKTKTKKIPKVKISDIRTINTRIRRETKNGEILRATQTLQTRAFQLGFQTKHDYKFLSKSNKALYSDELRDAIDYYKEEYRKEKKNKNYRIEEDFKALMKNLKMTESEYRVLAEESDTEDEFVNTIINLINEYNTWDDDYKEKFNDWLNTEYKKYHKGRWNNNN